MKKSLALTLAALMACGTMALLPACNGGGGGDYDGSNFLTREEAIEQYGNEYRIVKEQITLKIFVPRGSMNPEYSSMKMFKKLSEVTNLKFEFTEADTSSYTNLRTAAWNGDLPDFFLFANTMAEQVNYSELKAIYAFNDPNLEVEGVKVGSLIDNYRPTYKKLLDENFNIDTTVNAKDVVTLDNGLMYATVAAMDVPRDLSYKMWINEEWINNINTTNSLKSQLKAQFGVEQLPMSNEVDTIEELLLVLRAFKKLDANRNGDANDEIPVSSNKMQYLRNFIMAAYGAVFESVEISNDGSTFTYTPATEAYKKYLEVAKLMYDEGLMDANTFQNQDASMAAKGYANRLGMFCAAAPYLVTGYDYDQNYKVFGPLTSDYYQGTPLHYGFSPFKASATMIPRGTPYVREVARLIDILYSELGQQLIAYGEEGVDWTWDNEEKTSWTFNVPEDWDGTQEEYRATITPNVGTGASVYWSYDFVGKMNDPIIKSLNEESERYIPYLKVPVPEEVILAKEDYSPVSLKLTDLGKYVEMAECNFILGEKGYNITSADDWNAYINKLKGYGYEDVLARYNAALARKNAKG